MVSRFSVSITDAFELPSTFFGWMDHTEFAGESCREVFRFVIIMNVKISTTWRSEIHWSPYEGDSLSLDNDGQQINIC